MKPKISLVIVTWNSRPYIEKCLECLSNQTYTNYEIIVVDNASLDSTIEYLNQSHSHLTIIKNQKNLGFAKAGNQGIKASGGEFVLMLNPDVFPEPNFLEELLKFISQNSRYGAVGGKLLAWKDGKTSRIVDSTGLFVGKNLKARDRGNGHEDRGQYDQKENIFAVCGAAVLFRKEALEKVKFEGEYFDEDFFAYYEDLDLGWRMQLAGFECGYNPRAVAYHVRGGSGYTSKFFQKSFFMQRITLKNRYVMLIKNLSLGNLVFFSFPFFLTEIFLMFYSCTYAPHLLKIYFDIFRNLNRFLKKRSFIQQSRTKDSRYIRNWIKMSS
ncbi:MAG TPA: glycosyltransferase family 2 protein [Thermodesulfobacteriota bacterium]|nr:glycosyltransferase family 2 protein [Thermodesulfobacteriota bacterium]